MNEIIDENFAQSIALLADIETYPEFLKNAGLPHTCDFCGHTLNAITHITVPVHHFLSEHPFSSLCGTNCLERYLVHCLGWRWKEAQHAIKHNQYNS